MLQLLSGEAKANGHNHITGICLKLYVQDSLSFIVRNGFTFSDMHYAGIMSSFYSRNDLTSQPVAE